MSTTPQDESRTRPDGDEPRRIGRYVIHGTIHSTGATDVFSGYDPRLDRVVAIKRVVADGSAEARLHARLNHPGIVRVYEAFTHEGDDYIVSELVNGVSVATLVLGEGEGRALPLGRALPMMRDLTAALAHAHAEGIVHRDLKLENVLIGADGAVKLTDFGLAEDARGSTGEGSTLSGTFRCMSPEQSWGGPTDERSDIFSLGVCFYEILSGKSPFIGPDSAALLRNVRESVPPSLRQVREAIPVELSELVDRMLEKRPEDRPAAETVARTLARLEQRTSAGSSPAPLEATTRQVAVAVIRASEHGGAGDRVHVLHDLQTRVTDAVEAIGGSVLYVGGARISVCIGYPRSHDNNCERAAELLLDLHAGSDDAHLPIASTLDFGMATIVRRPSTPTVLGDLVDDALGASFQVRSGEILLLPHAARVLARSFDVQADARSVSTGGRTAALSRLGTSRPARSARGLLGRAPLVAREQELARLDSACAAARRGNGGALVVVGEAGVGKTRLLQEWRARLDEGTRAWVMFGTEDSRYTPFEAVRRFVAERLGVASDARSAELRSMIAEGLASAGITEPRWAEAIEALFDPARHASSYDGSLSREVVLDRLTGVLLAMASRAPTVLVVEDVHWLDHSSLAIVRRVAERVSRYPLLLVLSARTDADPPWPEARDFRRIDLSRLDEGQATAVVEGLVGGQAPARLVRSVVQQAEGVPLLLEQLSHALATADGSVSHEALLRATPTPLRDSVQRRLEGLGGARSTLESLAVLGHDVPDDLVCAVAVVDREVAARHFDEARRADLLDSGRRPFFRHALIREAVYDSLGDAQRGELHARVVEMLASRFAPLVAERPELYARHYEVAGQVEKAITLWENAGIAARRRWAYEEASRHLRAALDLITTRVEASSDRDRREREVLRSLYPAETAVNGWADAKVQELLARGKEIDTRLGDTPALGALWGQWIMSLISHDVGGLETALGAIASAGDSTEVRFMGNLANGVTSYHRGDLLKASEHLVAARDTVLGSLEGRLAPAETLDLSAASGWSEEVLASPSLYLGVIETCRGRYEQSERLQVEAEEIAERIGSLYALSFALGCRTVNGMIRRDSACFAGSLPRLEEICAGDAGWLAFARAQLGAAKAIVQVESGEAAAGADAFCKSVAILAAMGFKVSSELHLAACADACREAGMLEEAERQIEAGLAIADHELSGIYAPQVYLAAARLARARGRDDDARAFSQKARTAFEAIRTGDVPARLIAYHLDADDDPTMGPFSPS